MSLPSHHRHRCLLLAITSLALGCGKPDQIQTYTVAKEPAPLAAGEVASATGNNPAQPAAATDRMLAAILPDGGRAWFFKVVGPMAAIDKHAEAIDGFFASVRPAGDKPLPAWKLPEGWTQQPGNEFRAATIVIPGDKPLDLTVSTLGWSGSQDDLLLNINRWRGQMQLAKIGPQQLAESTREVKAGDATITVVDLTGRFQSGMTPPFAGRAPFAGGANAPPGLNPSAPNAPAGPAELPAGHPPLAPDSAKAASAPAIAPRGPAQSDVPKFTLPEKWKVLPIEEGSMRKAAFDVADGSKQALITVTQFSARVPAMADPLQNVNRWRGEIGLSRVDDDTLEKVTESIEVGGEKATFMAAIPDTTKPEESQVEQATLAAMVRVGDEMWFFKMKGNRDLVAAEQQNFRDFLKSVRFTAGPGAPDGN